MTIKPKLPALAIAEHAVLVDVYLGVPIVYYSFVRFPRVKREYHWTINGVTVESKNLKSARGAIAHRMREMGITHSAPGESLTHNRLQVSKDIIGRYGARIAYHARENASEGRINRVKPE